MNYTKHLLVPIICLLLLSCSKDNDENADNNTPSAKTSLPVKLTYTDASGTVIRTNNITYDTQKRKNKLVVVNQNASLNYTETFSYENGKITIIKDWSDPVKPEVKWIFFYDTNGVTKENYYLDSNLTFIYEWFYRPDGGKERRVKNTSGDLVLTYYYRYNATGNIERMVTDNVSPSVEDEEYTFGTYDTKSRSFSSIVNVTGLSYILGFPGTNLPAPNNPLTMTYKSGNNNVNENYEYTYNNKNQVIVTKVKNSTNGSLKQTQTIEYQEF